MKSSKSSLFLMELIIAILFFSLASAVCIQLFVKSHLLGRTTTEENSALLMCQNFNEIYLGSLTFENASSPELLKEQILALTAEDDSFTGICELSATESKVSLPEGEFSLAIYYDGDWKPCKPDHCRYQVVYTFEGYDDDSDVYRASSYAYRIEESISEIYHLNICKHLPERMQ